MVEFRPILCSSQCLAGSTNASSSCHTSLANFEFRIYRYTTRFAHQLAEAVHAVVPAPTEGSNIAYICCPTGYIAAQSCHPSSTTLLLEFDQRFAVAAASSGGGHFIHYDLEEDKLPNTVKGTVELAVVDPPFLNEVSLRTTFLRRPLMAVHTGHKPPYIAGSQAIASSYERQACAHYIHLRDLPLRCVWRVATTRFFANGQATTRT